MVITGHIYGPTGHRIAQKWPISFRLGVTAKKTPKKSLFFVFLPKMGSFLAVTQKYIKNKYKLYYI